MWKTLSIIASVLLAGAGAVAHLKKQDIAEARNDLQKAQENEASLDTQIDEVEKNLEAAKADLEAAKQKSEADRATLADLEENVANLKVDLEDKDAEKAAVESELSDMEEKIAVVGQIEELKTVITQLQAEKNAAEGKVANLKSQLNGAIAEKDSTDAALSKLQDRGTRQGIRPHAGELHQSCFFSRSELEVHYHQPGRQPGCRQRRGP